MEFLLSMRAHDIVSMKKVFGRDQQPVQVVNRSLGLPIWSLLRCFAGAGLALTRRHIAGSHAKRESRRVCWVIHHGGLQEDTPQIGAADRKIPGVIGQ
jgi:hypothetical protein